MNTYTDPMTMNQIMMGMPSATLERMICENKKGREAIVSRIARSLKAKTRSEYRM